MSTVHEVSDRSNYTPNCYHVAGLISAQSQSSSIYFGKVKPIPIVVVCFWLLMLATGTNIINSFLLATSILFGLMAVNAAGGIKSVAGLLNFVLILKLVLLSVLIKAATLQPTDSNMHAPRTTSYAMAVGFFGLYIGSLIYRHATKIRGLVGDVTNPKMYLALTIVFSVICLGSAFLVLTFQTSYETNLSGGLWGFAHQYEVVASFCVVPAMYYVWSSGSKYFLSHPLVLSILAVEIAWGFASTTKQGIMEPLLCYVGVGFIRYGWRSRAVWGVMASGAFVYVFAVYPYSQFVRSHGGRDGSLSERLEVMQQVLMSVVTDSDFREAVDSQILNDEGYLGKASLAPVSRFAMIGEADLLIAATDDTQSYTGWETIINGLKLMVPSFLMPDKPTSGGGNFLGHIVGELAPDDMSTQISYGFMANFYNAFGLYGVLFGSIILIALLYYVLRLWFAASDLTFGPYGSTIWYLLLFICYEHSLVEAPVGNILPSLLAMSAVVFLIFLSTCLVWMFGQKRERNQYV